MTPPARWWREPDILIIVALVAAAYFARAGDLTIRGEESRRATVALEMLRSGNYVVPTQQGELFLSRPPFHNWLIAGATVIRGQCDAIAVRAPTLLAVLLTSLLIYAYGRTFLNGLGALTAAVAFATMGEVLQMGRIAECDMVFTFLMSSAVLLWHWGYSRGWPATTTWIVGYSFCALAALTKGPQPPVYFGGTVIVFLAWRRDWRYLVSLPHLIGVLTFVAIVAAWQVPYLRMAGADATLKIWTGDSAARFTQLKVADVLTHLTTFPLEVLGCSAPWSLFAFAFLSRRFRANVGVAGPNVAFLMAYFAIGFLPVWASPGGMTRYVLPLYPSVALLAGLVVQRTTEVELSKRMSRAWSASRTALGGAMVATAAAFALVSAVTLHPAAAPMAERWPIVVAYSGCVAVFAVLVRSTRVRSAVLALAAFMALTYSVPILSAMARRGENAPDVVARVKADMPAGARMVSFNGVHHLFAYLYGEPIEVRPMPQADDPNLDEVTYFCYSCMGDLRMPLPFAWEEVAVVSVDRNRQPKPVNIVVVGRRVAPPTRSASAAGD